MHIYRTFFISAAILIRITAAANASPVPEQSPGPQFVALTPGNWAATVISPPSIVNLPPASIPRESPAGTRNDHIRVWPGYDSDVALHPYTSNMGPCPEGLLGAGCSPTHGDIIPPSHYERAPFGGRAERLGGGR
jgi:hypothetical protein